MLVSDNRIAHQFRVFALVGCVFLVVVSPGTWAQAQNRQLTPEQQAAIEAAQRQELAADGNRFIQPKKVTERFQGFNQTPEQIQRVNQILDYWQQSSGEIKKLRCPITRYQFDTGLVNQRDPITNQLFAAIISTGEINYSAPQQARYEINQQWKFKAPPKAQGDKADYQKLDAENYREKWIYDGATIYEFDYEAKRLYETTLPENMRGEAGVANSPIPFLFGVNRQRILDRYWVREITPQNSANEYWLEARPKRAEDAQIYQRVEIVIAEHDFLPKAIRLYVPGYNPKEGNFGSMHIDFGERQVNTFNIKDLFNRPTKPLGWERSKRTALASPTPPGKVR